MGTVGYMAPEQVRRQTVDARADLFALGTVLYEMLSGRRPFPRDTAPETMTAILNEDPPDLSSLRPEIPPGLDRIDRHGPLRDGRICERPPRLAGRQPRGVSGSPATVRRPRLGQGGRSIRPGYDARGRVLR